MPFWRIYHPANAYSEEEKQAFSEIVTSMYANVPIPKFYVVCLFEEVSPGTLFVGGKRNDNFVRVHIDHIARTLPGAVMREWWMRTIEASLAPFLRDKGFEWEVSVDETPFDLWTLQGEIPPPFQSVGEKRWIDENKASPYSFEEKLPLVMTFTPGVHDGQ